MRLRRHYKYYKRSPGEGNNDFELQLSENEQEVKTQKTKKIQNDHEAERPQNVKEAKPAKPFQMIKDLMKNNPNLSMQIMVILISLTSDNIKMDRRIDGMTSTIDKVRNITELVNNGMKSMKMVSEVPKSIRRILE